MTSSQTNSKIELEKNLDIHINIAKCERKFDQCINANLTNVSKEVVSNAIKKSLDTNQNDVGGRIMHMSIFGAIASSIVNNNKTWARVDKNAFSQQLRDVIKYSSQNEDISTCEVGCEIGRYKRKERYHKAILDKIIPERGSAFSPDLDYQLNLTDITSCKLGVSLLDCNTVGLLFKCKRLQQK
jgi:hypothetical protein